MIKSKPGKQFAAASQALCLQVLADDPGDNTYGHTPLHIQTGDGKRYIVLFAGHPVVIAGVGYRIDTVGEAHIDNTLVDICDTAGILALDTALLQVVSVGVLGNTLDVSLDAQVFQTVAPHTENPDQHLIAYGKTLMGVTDPVPGKVTGKDGGFNAENFHAHNLFSYCNHTRLDDAALIDTVHTGSIRIQIENLAFAQHGLLAAGNYAAGFGVDTTHDEVNVSAEHVAKDLILAQHKVGVFLTGRAAAQIDHHFLDRDNDTEPLVIHNCHRLAVVQLFNAAQLAGDDLAGAVGIMDFMPDYIITVFGSLDIIPAADGKDGDLAALGADAGEEKEWVQERQLPPRQEHQAPQQVPPYQE